LAINKEVAGLKRVQVSPKLGWKTITKWVYRAKTPLVLVRRKYPASKQRPGNLRNQIDG
jgi:hypothetical protein